MCRLPCHRRGLNPVVEPLRDVIARHGLQATKALGQNFILDRQPRLRDSEIALEAA